MKIPRMAKSVGYIDNELIANAAQFTKNKSRLIKRMPLAACFALVLTAGVILAVLFANGTNNTSTIDKRYKNVEITSSDFAIVWPWEYLAESERYYEAEINGVKYEKKSGRTVSEEFIGDKIGRYNISGYDGIMILEGDRVTVPCDVYQLKNVNQTEFIAVKIGDSYYAFKNAVYNPPQTLGELFERVDLSQFLKLERFSENGDGPDTNHFVLKDDDFVWEILSGCQSAVFIDQDQEYWHMYDRNFISFSVSSEALGVYKQGFSITEDGYLSTNVFDWGYLYYIGEEAAGKIIKYARDNSVPTEYKPYNNSIYGEIVEITDKYILVDDSILCKKPTDGITYKILLNDIRISRYVDRTIVEAGDTVQISYEGEIDKQNSNTISSAISISKVNIYSEDEIKKQNYNHYNADSSSTVSKAIASISE